MYDKSSVRSCVNVSVEFVTLLPSIMIKQIRSNHICCDVMCLTQLFNIMCVKIVQPLLFTKLPVFGLKFDCSHRKNSTLGLLIKLDLIQKV